MGLGAYLTRTLLNGERQSVLGCLIVDWEPLGHGLDFSMRGRPQVSQNSPEIDGNGRRELHPAAVGWMMEPQGMGVQHMAAGVGPFGFGRAVQSVAHQRRA